MSSIPGAHASLGFGRKQIEFYAAPGVTAGEGSRRGEHEIRDADGQIQSFRLSRPDTPLDSGETVTVLRAQSGPEHGSRPVAVINHDRNAWTRTVPEATTVLSRSGVIRALNWWLAMMVFLLAALVFAWPDLRLFMLEVDPALFASLPDFNVFSLLLAQMPSLAGFDLAAAIPGFAGLAEQSGLTGFLSAQALAFVVLLTPLAILTYANRSWRIVLVPVYVFGALVTGLALNATAPVAPATFALAGIAALFAIAGFINRTRDSARFEGRVARLSENILRHPPAESVSAPAATVLAATSAAAVATELDAPDDADAPSGPEAADDTEITDAEFEDVELSEADVEADDDLPSDEALAAAQADDSGDGTAGDEDILPVETRQNTDPSFNAVSEEPPADRDMILPPPPPMANRSMSEGGGSGEVRASRPELVTADDDAVAEPQQIETAQSEPVDAGDATPAPDAPEAAEAGEIGAAPEISPDAVIPAEDSDTASGDTQAAESEDPETPQEPSASDDEADPFLSSGQETPRPDGEGR
ncbi:hypothetical protein [Hyphobacterium sp.]|uniref:hypothetical protein n=1 Tax=Hyphobacterium sp. TaxID=2004662 RepID=UPI003BAA3573